MQLPLEMTGVTETAPAVGVLSVTLVAMLGTTMPSVPVQETLTGKLLPVRSVA